MKVQKARAHLTVACASVCALLLVAGSLPLRAQSSSTPPIRFEVPAVVDPIHTNGEPDIGIDVFGRVFVSGPTGTGTQRSTWFGSVDRGHTFRIISPGLPPNAITGLVDPPGGGDTDINFDRSGKQYFVDLYALICNRTATTSDGGATVMQSISGGCADGTAAGSDRPWLAVYDPPPNIRHLSPYTGQTPLIYVEYNNLVGPGPNGGAQWNKSTDGLTYVNALADVPAGTAGVYSPFGPDGYPAIDQVTGNVFQAAGFPNQGGTSNLLLNIGTPDTTGNLHFLDAPTSAGNGPNYANLIHITDNLPGSPDTLFTVLSMDTARNLFVAWALSSPSTKPARRQVFVSAASAASGWRNWTPPGQASDASLATGDAVNVFPWIKAGGPGRADAGWDGSNKNVDPSSHSGQAWNVFMSQVVYPIDSKGVVSGA